MTGFVYAISDGRGCVKIGWSTDPVRRLNKIRSDCPSVATLLGLVPATRAQEQEVHELLQPWRENREWFRHEGAVVAFINMLSHPRPKAIFPPSGNALRRYRIGAKLSLEALASSFDVNKSTLLRWEERGLPAKHILIVERITGIPRHELRPDLYRPTERFS